MGIAPFSGRIPVPAGLLSSSFGSPAIPVLHGTGGFASPDHSGFAFVGRRSSSFAFGLFLSHRINKLATGAPPGSLTFAWDPFWPSAADRPRLPQVDKMSPDDWSTKSGCRAVPKWYASTSGVNTLGARLNASTGYPQDATMRFALQVIGVPPAGYTEGYRKIYLPLYRPPRGRTVGSPHARRYQQLRSPLLERPALHFDPDLSPRRASRRPRKGNRSDPITARGDDRERIHLLTRRKDTGNRDMGSTPEVRPIVGDPFHEPVTRQQGPRRRNATCEAGPCATAALRPLVAPR